MNRSREKQGAAVAIGTFDGVHLGHQFLIRRMARIARRKKLRSIVVTLERPVREVPGLLTTLEEKVALLRALPVDEVIILPVSPGVIRQPAKRFFEDFLLAQLRVRHLVIGWNFAFGYRREGDAAWLRKEGKKNGVAVTVVHPFLRGEETVSSTHIRSLLLNGEIEKANLLLGRTYHFQGMPCAGRGVGRTIGVPTVNLQVPEKKLLPPGVSAVILRRGRRLWPAVMNVGTRPTFLKKGAVVPEAAIFGYRSRWPRARTGVYFCCHLRRERRFSSVPALLRQIRNDRARARDYFGISTE